MGKPLPNWSLASFFISGISTEYESYAFQYIQMAKPINGEIVDFERLVAALVEYDRRLKSLDERDALDASTRNVGKQENAGKIRGMPSPRDLSSSRGKASLKPKRLHLEREELFL